MRRHHWWVTLLRRLAPLLAWSTATALAVAVLIAAGQGTLAAPDLTRPGSWADWAAGRSPAVAAMAVLRLVALGLAAWLLAGTAATTVLAVARGGIVPDLADVLTLPAIRGAVHLAVGAGITGASLAAVGAGGAVPVASDRPPVLRLLDEPAASTSTSTTSATSSTTVVPTTSPGPALAPPSSSPTPRTWTVAPGDHLWSIAASAVGSADTALVTPYWERLVEANRAHLVDPANPDLLFPGDQLVLPDR